MNTEIEQLKTAARDAVSAYYDAIKQEALNTLGLNNHISTPLSIGESTPLSAQQAIQSTTQASIEASTHKTQIEIMDMLRKTNGDNYYHFRTWANDLRCAVKDTDFALKSLCESGEFEATGKAAGLKYRRKQTGEQNERQQ